MRHLVHAKSFAEMLERAIKAYDLRAIEAAQVIEALIDLAKKMNAVEREAGAQRGRVEHVGTDELQGAVAQAIRGCGHRGGRRHSRQCSLWSLSAQRTYFTDPASRPCT